jgi:DNA polymerase-3 subunit epsilon
MQFLAIDVETANAQRASICQIGIVSSRNGTFSECFSSLINPNEYFDEINVMVHGIDEEDVEDAPTFADVWDEVNRLLNDQIVISYSSFDRVAIQRACDKYGLPHPNCHWLDSMKMVRRTWNEFSMKGYGLSNVCSFLGFEFKHHDALEDARACAFVTNEIITKSGKDFAYWLERVLKPLKLENANYSKSISKEGNPNGEFFGEVLAFTGTLSRTRSEFAAIAAEYGFNVKNSVTKKTTYLIIGDQDESKLNGNVKSSKHRKAEDLLKGGHNIHILYEADFIQIISD